MLLETDWFARKKLLAEKRLTFQWAVSIATNYETIERDARSIQQQHETVEHTHKVDAPSGRGTTDRPCHRCGRQGHTPNTCRFRNVHCKNCSKLGHIAAVCQSSHKKKSFNKKGELTKLTSLQMKSPMKIWVYFVFSQFHHALH